MRFNRTAAAWLPPRHRPRPSPHCLHSLSMHPAPTEPAPIESEIVQVYSLYSALALHLKPETGLGGTLLYTADPAESGSAILRAANIAGAASLAASVDSALLRRLMRESALDFVVTSLDEALRILKNEIRKREPVAVGVTVAAEAVEQEMVERGVQPNFLAPGLDNSPQLQILITRGARIVEPQHAPPSNFQILPIPPGQPAAAFDVLLLASLAPGDHLNRRWVRVASRYLPAAARRLRSIAADPGVIRNVTALR